MQKERERESKFSVKHICINNGMGFKFRLMAFTKICLMVDETYRTDKFRIKQNYFHCVACSVGFLINFVKNLILKLSKKYKYF